MLGAQIDEAGKTTHARHGEIEQDEIDVGIGFERSAQAVEIAAFRNLAAAYGAGDRLAQRAAHQRMVVGNNDAGRWLGQDNSHLARAAPSFSADPCAGEELAFVARFHL